MASLSVESVVTAAPEQVSCELNGEVVVLSLQTGEYYGLNPVAAVIWGFLQSPISVGELRDKLLEEFSGVTAEECMDEVTNLINELADMGLVSIA